MGCATSCVALSAAGLDKDICGGDEAGVLMRLAEQPRLLSTPAGILQDATPMHRACKTKNINGADPWVADLVGGRTAVHYAATGCQAACLQVLLRHVGPAFVSSRGSRYVDARSSSGLTPLHYAVYYGSTEALRELLMRHDPHLNAVTTHERRDMPLICEARSSPLHVAAIVGNVSAARELLLQYARLVCSGRRIVDPRTVANAAGQLPWQVAVALRPLNPSLAALLHPRQHLERSLEVSFAMRVGGVPPGLTVLEPLRGSGPPPLAVIAATAARRKLLADLQQQAHHQLIKAPTLLTSAAPAAAAVVVGATTSLDAPLLLARADDEAADSSREGPAAGLREGGGASSSSSMSRTAGGKERSLRRGNTGCSGGSSSSNDNSTASRGSGTTAAAAAAGDDEDDASQCGVCFAARVAVAPAGCSHGLCGSCAERLCRGLARRPLQCPFCRRVVTAFVAHNR
ncbi:hypothetical protein PLESTB_000373500 [Pleodorina starrii]|uniref:RING-type domain-containing protein n=1 Tax=Pleodorina starrii TaxID=330485 RepID=A0A9W6BDZ7_9CHLO|nr:hypothetical protein PLESTB_000373500 [Pleodorina starrii]